MQNTEETFWTALGLESPC